MRTDRLLIVLLSIIFFLLIFMIGTTLQDYLEQRAINDELRQWRDRDNTVEALTQSAYSEFRLHMYFVDPSVDTAFAICVAEVEAIYRPNWTLEESWCTQAIRADPANGIYRDVRGLVRLHNGDEEGALVDFQFYIQWLRENGLYEEYAFERSIWVTALIIWLRSSHDWRDDFLDSGYCWFNNPEVRIRIWSWCDE